MYEYKTKIERVVDIDTFVCSIDLGFDIKIQHKIRLLEVDGYETKLIRGATPSEVVKGKEGKTFIQAWLTGKEGIIQTHKDSADKYGRYLGVLLINQNEKLININQWIIENGYGVPTNESGQKDES